MKNKRKGDKLTDSQVKALTILKDTSSYRPMSCSRFAQLMWPDSNMHLKSSNQGNGATRGKAAWLSAGSYLAKLRKLKLVDNFSTQRSFYGYYISEEGLKLLKKQA